ncbi:glycerate kinase [Zophobihabitans entericus]|uniref:Glycerate kinase n=1 Tax=Zophobihabitans entericus TaxID=1635327 RepID=A0A6G9I8Q4_9GAMM|nr:glycerate kinase [Zophobihabitans entericus]QIQ20595.1 glycerate kinase [Zophobihabitans entericus]
MKIVIAPDSFKESLSALEVAKEVKKGFAEVFDSAEYILLPVADGGEGTVDAMVDALKGTKITIEITDPLGQKGQAFYGLSGDKDRAIIEMAAASGLERVPVEKRDPRITTSYGTGELIKDALSKGVTHCIIGIGGSATNDGGAGMLQALGVKLLNKQGKQIGFGGAALADLDRIDISGLDPRVKECQIDTACDVTNPLTGPNGASAIFGPQKGATPDMIKELDQNLSHFADIIKRDLGLDVATVPGTGAAGGMGIALLAFLNATLKPGIEIITGMLGLEELIKNADLVITGEGRVDNQSVNGKVPVGVAKLAQRHQKPVIAIAGSLGDKVEIVYPYGITAVYSVLNKITTLKEALDPKTAADNLRLCARNVAATIKIGISLKH